jgi:hypothetical protein
MDIDKYKIEKYVAHIKKYKKPLMAVAIAGAMFLALLFVGAGYLAYKVVGIAGQKFEDVRAGSVDVSAETSQISDAMSGVVNKNAGEISESAKEAVQTSQGFIEGFVVSLATIWLKNELAGVEIAQFKNGLACFDAMGGPSPGTIINHARQQIGDKLLIERLDNFAKNNLSAPVQGPSACAQWLLNG